MKVIVIYRQDALHSHEKHIPFSDIPLYVPPIGTRFVLVGDVCTVGDVKYDLDNEIITVYSTAYLQEAGHRQQQWEHAEKVAMESYPRHTWGNNRPDLKERLLEV